MKRDLSLQISKATDPNFVVRKQSCLRIETCWYAWGCARTFQITRTQIKTFNAAEQMQNLEHLFERISSEH